VIPKQLRLLACFFTALLGVQAQTAVPVFGGNAQHTANYRPAARNLNAIRWSSSVDLGSVDLGTNGKSTHYGAPAISGGNTVFVPVRTATNGFQINAVSGNTGGSIYTLSTDYIAPGHNPMASYGPALATGSHGTRLYYAGAGGSVYYIENPDSRPGSAPVQQVFYGLSNYQANRAGFNSSVFINTPITTDSNGDIFFGFAVQGTAPAPLNTTQSGFARIDPNGRATYVLAGVATGDSNIARDSQNSAPALSNDESTLYVLAKAAKTDSYGYLVGLDSSTLETRYKTVLRDPGSGNYATISDDSTASPVVAPDDDVFLGVTGNPQDNHRGFLLHFNLDLTVTKVPGAFGRDFTPAIVPATMVTSYKGSSSYLIFSRYNDYPGEDGGQGVNRIALLDPNSTQLDPHPSAHSLTEMREVLTASSVTPDTYYVAAGFPFAVSEWSAGAPGVNPATNSIYVPNADGHIYRWDLSTDSLSQSAPFAAGKGASNGPLAIGPDGTIYTINGGGLFAAGDAAGIGVTVTSSSPDLRNAVAGDAVTFTAAVGNSVAPGIVATGTVTFRDISFQNGAPLSVTLGTVPVDAAGHASFTTSSLRGGAHFITAAYSGNANADSAAMVQLIHASATSVTLASSLSSSNQERGRSGAAMLTATVTPSSASVSGVPSGMVTFTDNDNVVAQIPLSAGAASFNMTASRAGTHVFGAVYSSDGIFAASTGTLTTEASRTSNRTPFAAGSPSTTDSRALRPLANPGGTLFGIGDSSYNPESLTLEGTSDWIHWGPPAITRKAGGGAQISDFTTVFPNTTVVGYSNEPRLLSWTDGIQNNGSSASQGDDGGDSVPTTGNGFSFTAPADTTVRTLVVHAGGYFSGAKLTAQLSDSSAPDFVDITTPITALYDRNYVITYKAASAGQTLTVKWVEVTDLGAGNVNLSGAALSVFTGTIATHSGNPQSTTVNTAFPTPLQVAVTDANGNPVSGATVTFTAATATLTNPATGSFSTGATATAVTGSNGMASAPTFTANTVTGSGSYFVTASVSGVPNAAQFSLTNVAGPPVSMTPVNVPASGYNAVVNTIFTPALQAQVKDFYGNPVNGATVTFSDTPAAGQAGAVFASGTTATGVTNASGIAFAPTLTANSFQGHYNVGATVGSVTINPLYFLNNTPGGGGFLAGAGDSSQNQVNLTAVGTSDWIHWGDNVPNGINRKATGGSQISDFSYASTMVGQDRTGGSAGARSVVPRVSGRVTKLHPENMGFEQYRTDFRQMNWSDGTPTLSDSNGNGDFIDFGTYISYGRNGFTFTAPASLTARTLTVYVGGNNSGGTLVAHLSDGSAPDFVDTTATNNNSGGYDRNYTLTYSAASNAVGVNLTVTWTMTSGNGNVTLSGAALSVGVPSTITATAGNPQSALVNAVFATPLQVTVVDANNKALSGVLVTFVAPGTGATAAFSGSSGAVVPTNSQGIATAPALQANATAGHYTVIATLAGAKAPAVFNLYNLIPGGSLSGSGTVFDSTSTRTTANLTTAGTVDWVHWGSASIRKYGVVPQIKDYSTVVVGPQSVINYSGDSRTLTWTDGPPSTPNSDDSGVYIQFVQNQQAGFSFTVPADLTKRTLTVYLGGFVTTGMLTAHLSDQSAADFVDTTLHFSNTFDGTYTLTYNAASANQTLTITWVTAENSGNVTLSGAALSITPPLIATAAGTPQSAQVNTPFATALQALVADASNNPLSGLTVTFTASTSPTNGASATFSGLPSATAVSNSSGIATAPVLTANAQPGSYTVMATIPAAVAAATFSLSNFLGGGTLSGSGNSSTAAVNLTAVGTGDWVHLGDPNAPLNRKSGVSPQIGQINVVGQATGTYSTELRLMSWTDGTPLASNSADANGAYVYYPQNGYSFTVPADVNMRTLSVYVGGYASAGTLTARLSDLSAADYVDTTADTSGAYDRNYTLIFSAASPGQTLMVSWMSASPTGNLGNVTLSGAALSGASLQPFPLLAVAGTHTGNFTQGQQGALYTISVSNAGTAATSGTVTATDTLPAGLTAAAISGTGWTCTVSPLACTRADALAAGASYPAIAVTVNVASNASAQVTNVVGASGGGSASVSASDITTITTAGVTAKVGIFRSGLWVIDKNGNSQWDGAPPDETISLGQAGDIAVVGDWNGDGRAKAGIFRNGLWVLDYNGNGVWDGPSIDRVYNLGQAGDTPVVGDWNGSGFAKIGVFRNGLWILDYNGNGQWDGPSTDRADNLGQTGDIPVVGDWNGSGFTKIGVFRNGLWVLDYNGNGQWDGPSTDHVYNVGQTGDIPVVGDWNASGFAKIGIFRGGLWVLDYNGNGVWDGPGIDRAVSLGQDGDIPVVGDWNGSGFAKVGIFRSGLWVLDYNGNGAWDGPGTDRAFFLGQAGDIPTVSPW
jgi:hypothetical protein